MIKPISNIRSIKRTIYELSDFIGYGRIRVTVYDRNFIPLMMFIAAVIRITNTLGIELVSYARINHLNRLRRLKIYIVTDRLELSVKDLAVKAHCKVPLM